MEIVSNSNNNNNLNIQLGQWSLIWSIALENSASDLGICAYCYCCLFDFIFCDVCLTFLLPPWYYCTNYITSSISSSHPVLRCSGSQVSCSFLHVVHHVGDLPGLHDTLWGLHFVNACTQKLWKPGYMFCASPLNFVGYVWDILYLCSVSDVCVSCALLKCNLQYFPFSSAILVRVHV